jgi:hypothetical protein
MEFVNIIDIILEDEPEDVYNLEVPETECFAVNGGLIIHNCRYAIEDMNMSQGGVSFAKVHGV